MRYHIPSFGQFDFRVPVGEGSQRQQQAGPPLGKVTIDTTPQLTARIDRLTTTTETIANQAQLTGLMGLGLITILGIAYLRRC